MYTLTRVVRHIYTYPSQSITSELCFPFHWCHIKLFFHVISDQFDPRPVHTVTKVKHLTHAVIDYIKYARLMQTITEVPHKAHIYPDQVKTTAVTTDHVTYQSCTYCDQWDLTNIVAYHDPTDIIPVQTKTRFPHQAIVH